MSAQMTITIEHNGVSYSGEIMTIKSTTLGYEDHGILSAQLNCEGSGTGTSVGGYCLDEPVERGTSSGRKGTAYGLDHLIKMMETVGVSRWEKLPGQKVIVLYGSEGHWGLVAQGIANIVTGSALIFKEHAEQWLESAS